MTAPAPRISTLLVVDDNEANRDVLSRRLTHRGYQVRVASGGAEAIAMVAAGRFDLVLLDVEMPGISGFDVLTALRTTHSRTRSRVAVCSGLFLLKASIARFTMAR